MVDDVPTTEQTPRRFSLTPRQRDVYNAIVDYHAEHRCFPTIKELASIIGMSHTGAHEHLNKLVDKGYILKMGDSRRSRRFAIADDNRAVRLHEAIDCVESCRFAAQKAKVHITARLKGLDPV